MDERELERIAEAVVRKLRGGSGERGAGPDVSRLGFDVGDVGVGPEPTPSGPAPCSPLPNAQTNSLSSSPLPASRFQLPDRLASLIDHTLLKPEATRSDIEKLCADGLEHKFASVCVEGSWVELCAKLVGGSGVKIDSVAGFPLGAGTSKAKAFEAKELVELGADEIDMVAPIGRIIVEDWDYVEDDIRGVVDAVEGNVVKVILETALLSPVLIVKASAIAMEAGAQYVKTSTGLQPAGGASEEAVALMSAAVGHKLGVKAAGGIRDCTSALRMVAAGATRIGTSSGVEIARCVGNDPLKQLLLNVDSRKENCRCTTGSGDY